LADGAEKNELEDREEKKSELLTLQKNCQINDFSTALADEFLPNMAVLYLEHQSYESSFLSECMKLRAARCQVA